MDACDEVMEKVDRPKGLIRYASETSIKTGTSKLITGRVKAYSSILLLLIVGFIGLLSTREDLGATITRFRGMTYQAREDAQISNLYEVTLINKTFNEQEVSLVPEDSTFIIEKVGNMDWHLEGQSKFEGRFFLVKAQNGIKVPQQDVTLLLKQNGKTIDKISTSFMGPVNN
jgi:polyferredoxin